MVRGSKTVSSLMKFWQFRGVFSTVVLGTLLDNSVKRNLASGGTKNEQMLSVLFNNIYYEPKSITFH